MSLKIIGAGFGRTGTLSLKMALEYLGFGPCYHMVEVMKYPSHIDSWDMAINSNQFNWEHIFHNYSSTVDWPSSFFLNSLVKYYPEAKVILTIRNPNEWFDSISNTVFQAIEIGKLYPSLVGQKFNSFAQRLILEGVFHGKYRDRDYAIYKYNEYTKNVCKIVPSSRLLLFPVGSNWISLCNFLEVQIPSIPFPNSNHKNDFLSKINLLISNSKI